MKKKIIALLIITTMLLSLMPQAALAVGSGEIPVADGEMLNIGTGVLTHTDSTTETLTISDGDTISVDAGAAATITGGKNVMIDCGAGVALTIDGVTINSNGCALAFTGSGNLFCNLCHLYQPSTWMPIDRAEPAIMLIAVSTSSALRSFIFFSAMSRSWASVMVPTLSLPGSLEPDFRFIAFLMK